MLKPSTSLEVCWTCPAYFARKTRPFLAPLYHHHTFCYNITDPMEVSPDVEEEMQENYINTEEPPLDADNEAEAETVNPEVGEQ